MEEAAMAEWDAAYINDLPDSAFLLVEPGGHKDREGKTVPRTLRHFPVYNAAGNLDSAHLRNALGRIPQADSLSASQRETATSKAVSLARAHPSIGGPSGTYAGSAGSARSGLVAPDEEPLPAHIEVRAFEISDLDIRSDGAGRTLIGRAVPYGKVAELGRGRRERMAYGAFSRQVTSGQSHRVNIYQSHRRRMAGDFPIGATTHLEERADGLWGAWRLINSAEADTAIEVVNGRLVTGLSVGFSSPEGGTVKLRDGTEEVRRAHLDHVCLTDVPVYEDAQVMEVRQRQQTEADLLANWRAPKEVFDRIMSPG
jgi:HK97 family phage prohead protease